MQARKNIRMVLHRSRAGSKATLVGMQVTKEGSKGLCFIRAGKEGVGAHRKKTGMQGLLRVQD